MMTHNAHTSVLMVVPQLKNYIHFELFLPEDQIQSQMSRTTDRQAQNLYHIFVLKNEYA